ncbi:MAG: phosphatase [Eubacteriales bacterium]|jgi:putative hydrolase
MLQVVADMHCHTIASTHAYNTLFEMARYAADKGLAFIGITDHGPDMPDAPHRWHFLNTRIWPKEIEGITVVPGVEANVLDFEGRLDLRGVYLESLPWVVASCHREALQPGSVEQHTQMWKKVAQNPHVDLVGHCGQELFAFHKEEVIKTFKEYGKIVEINNNSALVRPDSVKNCVEIARLCKKYEVPVCVNSDAHIAFQVGAVEESLRMLEEIGFPEKLILNADAERITQYLQEKKGVEYRPVSRQ